MKKSEEFLRARRNTNVLGMVFAAIAVYLFKTSGYAEAKEKIAKKVEKDHDENVRRFVDIDGTKIDLDHLDD